MFRSELERLAERHPWLRVEIVLTRAGGGHLDADRLANLCPDWGTREAFVCGPDSLLDFAMEHWAASTVEERLHLERFTPPRALRSGADREGNATVRFGASAIAAASDGQHTLLELAETAGVAAPSGCRMGICHTCTTRLDNGCVRDLRDGRVIEAGSHVQLCVSVAEGDVTLDI